MTARTVRHDGITATEVERQRAVDVIFAIRTYATTGEELHAAMLKTPPERQADFLRALQRVISRLGR